MAREKLKKRRLDCGFTQEQVAEMVGISRSYYTRIEQGIRGTSLDNWLVIAKAINIPPNEIIEYATEK